MIPSIAAVYDRAALIALPEDLRQRYAKHLTSLMAPHSQMLLITLDSPDIVQGPPFPVSAQEINRLYATEFKIRALFRVEKNEIANHLCKKGYKLICETVYKLEKIDK